MLELYRAALKLRRDLAADTSVVWRDAPEGELVFDRGETFTCVVNISKEPVALPAAGEVVLASGALVDGMVPVDVAVWIRR
jgi:alpha-glucosidase